MAGRLHTINGVAGVGFAGAWMGFGFHEDGFVSGTHAARVIMAAGDSRGGHDGSKVMEFVGIADNRSAGFDGARRRLAEAVLRL